MIKPIKTHYNKVTYKSRLEARWAIFFDELKIHYQYEVEGFDIDGTWYVPDFYLPDYKLWIEVKPGDYKWLDDHKIRQFSDKSHKKYVLILGAPQRDKYRAILLSKANRDEYINEVCHISHCQFALARRAAGPELGLLSDSCGCRLIDKSTDDGERNPVITDEMGHAYLKAVTMSFY